MLDIFSYDFVVNAFIIAYACAIVSAVLGSFLVASKQAVVSDMLAHTSLAGVGIGVLLHVSPVLAAISTALIASLVLYLLSEKQNLSKEAISVLLLSGGIAIALLCVHLAKDNPVSLETFLFGSILTVTKFEVYFFLGLSFLILGVVALFYRKFLTLSFDKEFFQSKFKYSKLIEILFILLVGLLVSSSLKIVGGLLISALLIIPVLSAQQISKSFKGTVGLSVIFNLLGVTSGIFCSFYWDIPSSSAIVLSLIAIFILSGVSKKLR